MADIALSNGVRQNLLSMQNTVDLMSRTQNRLATGKKVNSALDNPTNYFVAAGLENRSTDLSRLLDSMGLGIKTLEAADNGISAIKKLIETAQGTARQALQAASSNPKVTSAVTKMTGATDLTTPAGGGLTAGNTITIDYDSGTTKTFTIGTGAGEYDTVQELIDAINQDDTLQGSATAADGSRVKASLSADGRLVVQSQTGEELAITAADGTGAAGTGAAGLLGLFGTVTTADKSINTIRQSLAQQFEDLKGQIDQLVKDTGYNGVNLLNGDTLKVLFNETNTTQIEIAGVVFNAEGLGLSPLLPDGTSADSVYKWQSDDEINASLTKLSDALNKVRSAASDFGSNLIVLQTRQDFTKQSILTLNAGADLLTLADTSEEGANLLALQTRQQLSTQALAMASQTDQAVLRLFG
jgi:flagellin-like hook-associated protein FlgL